VKVRLLVSGVNVRTPETSRKSWSGTAVSPVTVNGSVRAAGAPLRSTVMTAPAACSFATKTDCANWTVVAGGADSPARTRLNRPRLCTWPARVTLSTTKPSVPFDASPPIDRVVTVLSATKTVENGSQFMSDVEFGTSCTRVSETSVLLPSTVTTPRRGAEVRRGFRE